jgi:hypothetical protein
MSVLGFVEAEVHETTNAGILFVTITACRMSCAIQKSATLPA